MSESCTVSSRNEGSSPERSDNARRKRRNRTSRRSNSAACWTEPSPLSWETQVSLSRSMMPAADETIGNARSARRPSPTERR